MTAKQLNKMKEDDMDRLLRRLAHETATDTAKAADRIEGLVHKILKQLRDGKPARVPGLGKFSPGHTTSFQAEGENAAPKRIVRRTPKPAR